MARQVEARTKRQTVRPWPKRQCDVPQVGHRISCREWTGRPYNSKQRVLCGGRIVDVRYIEIRRGSITFPGIWVHTAPREMTRFAKADGFESLRDFHAWFLKSEATVFRGVFIQWIPDDAAT